MGKNVLIIDSEPEVIESAGSILEKLGHQVSGSKDGEEATNKIRQLKPDLIILDLILHRKSGIMVYVDLKTNEAWKKIPVIINTKIKKKTFLRTLEELNRFYPQPLPEPEAYLEKPLKPDPFTKAIQQFLR
ncbi:MAG: response regulator [Proteobacteria bacterium]|nr:response regulator [Pseudomonadota bacterium]